MSSDDEARPERAPDRVQLPRPRADHGLLGPAPAQPPHRGDHDALRRPRVRPAAGRGGPRRGGRPARAARPGDARRACTASGSRSSATSRTRCTTWWPSRSRTALGAAGGDAVRAAMLDDFGIEIGTSFGPLHGKVWRIGTMGYNARKDAVLVTLAALERCSGPTAYRVPAGGGVDAAQEVVRDDGRRGARPLRASSTASPRCPPGSSASTSRREHARANAQAAAWMEQAGLRTWQDAAGNQWGRREGREPGLPALVLGSHLDTVPDAGSYDGMLGVVMAIAVAERLRRPGRTTFPFALEVVGLQRRGGHPLRQGAARQPGRRGHLGRRLVGPARPRRHDAARGVRGVRARPAPGRRRGRAGPESWSATSRRTSSRARYLEAADASLGYVTTIAGARRFRLTVVGEARHAGGTPYREATRRAGRRQRGDHRDRAAGPRVRLHRDRRPDRGAARARST